MEVSPHLNDEAKILIRCTRSQRERIKARAQASNLSMNDYILRSALKDSRYKDQEGASVLQPFYAELLQIKLRLQSLPDTVVVQEAIALVQAVQKEIALYHLARRTQNRDDGARTDAD